MGAQMPGGIRRCRKERGFTLLELLVAAAVLSIIAAVAVPSYRNLIQRNRVVTDANALLTTLTLARSEAIKRNDQVAICRSTDGSSCLSSSGDWGTGAMVFSDQNRNGALDAGEEIVRADVPLSRSSTISLSVNTLVRFRSSGDLVAGQLGGSFTIQPSSGGTDHRRKVVFTATGRPRICDPAKDATC
ncbi:MAG: GspH/FimT family pseudopilin [Sinimarinibacterium flocculans]|uniref:GspH/FimT family pseudopilin n=1 Tax=Sinimarinibacterium flocculans TaxID=985250 RepID=UPI003C468879